MLSMKSISFVVFGASGAPLSPMEYLVEYETQVKGALMFCRSP